MTVQFVLAALLALAAAPAQNQAGPPPASPSAAAALAAARQSIADANQAWGRARAAYDKATFEKTLTPEFYAQLPDRRMTRQEFIDQISRQGGPVKLVRFDASVLTVTKDGDGWVAVIHEKLDFERTGPDGRVVEKASSLTITRDGWKQVDGEWKATFTEVIGSELWRGGVKPPFKDW
jgi:hypothetical protein